MRKPDKPTNPLLVKYPVGRARPSCYNLPGEDHVYGKRGHVETGHGHQPQVEKKVTRQIDYIAMNKLSLKQKILDPKGQSIIRKQKPIYLPVIEYTSTASRKSRKLPSDNNPNFTYGVPTRASSPLANLMREPSFHEADSGETLVEVKRRTLKQQVIPLQKPKPRFIPIAERDPKTLFKMPRFRKISHKIINK